MRSSSIAGVSGDNILRLTVICVDPGSGRVIVFLYVDLFTFAAANTSAITVHYSTL